MSTAEPARELPSFGRTWPVAVPRVELREHDPRPGVSVLEVYGEVDLAEADAIRTRMAALLDGSRPRAVLDLSGVGFLGSHGLTAVVRSSRTAGDAGVRLDGVTGPGNRAVIRPILMTGLDRVITWYPDLPSALSDGGR